MVMLNTKFSSWPAFTDEEADAVRDVLISNKVNYWTGDECKKFEREFSEFSGSKYAVALGNGTLALDVALKALDIGVGDEVIVTSRTFIASVSSIVNSGAIPIFADVDLNTQNITLESVKISFSAGTGIGVLAEVINKNSDRTGVRASWQVQSTGKTTVSAGTISGLTINGINIGTISVQANDNDGKLVAAINRLKDRTGVEAFIDERGNLNLRSIDGRGIVVSAAGGLDKIGFDKDSVASNFGRLTLTRLDARDIQVEGLSVAGGGKNDKWASASINLRTIKGDFSKDQMSAIGFFANSNVTNFSVASLIASAGVTTLRGAMAVMDIADSAMRMLDKIRADIGSVQNQLVSTINNISVTQVNVKAAESQIRDVDFAAETANFQKYNLLAQSGSYALSQANASQQNVMRLLQ